MAQAAGTLSYATTMAKPPLDMGVRLRLSVMMFLQFAVWGSWFVVFGNYVKGSPEQGGLGFSPGQQGSLYGTMALGAIVSTMFAGQLADRVLSSEYLMAIFHLVGAVLLYTMASVHSYLGLWTAAFAYALVYNPTLAISNSLSFHHVPDATRDFPTLRVLGTIGWIAANMIGVDMILGSAAKSTNKPLLMAAALSAALGLFSLTLPHTPPSRKGAGAFPFLQAFGLLKDFSFGVFFIISFVITIALAFYYGFAQTFLESVGIQRVASVMTIGQWSEIGFMLLLPFALRRLGMKWVLAVGMLAWALRYALFSVSFPLTLVVIGVALHGVCFDFFLAAGFIHTDNQAPPSIRGSAQALFSFLTYGVGMFIGNELSGFIVGQYTVDNVTNWHAVWMWPSLGAAICLVLFVLLWRSTAGRVQEVDPVAETAASPADPESVSQTIA